MEWEVAFSKVPVVSTFRDASPLELELDGDLMASIKELVQKGKGITSVAGIEFVRTGEKVLPGEKFYILSVKKGRDIKSLLFSLDRNESRLVGVYPDNLSRDDVLSVLYDVLSRRAKKVSVVI